MRTMLEVKNLSVRVRDIDILRDVNLCVDKGTHVLFGPNGSGKTTLLLTILGFPRYEVMSGRIWFRGEDITDLPDSLKREIDAIINPAAKEAM